MKFTKNIVLIFLNIMTFFESLAVGKIFFNYPKEILRIYIKLYTL